MFPEISECPDIGSGLWCLTMGVFVVVLSLDSAVRNSCVVSLSTSNRIYEYAPMVAVFRIYTAGMPVVRLLYSNLPTRVDWEARRGRDWERAWFGVLVREDHKGVGRSRFCQLLR